MVQAHRRARAVSKPKVDPSKTCGEAGPWIKTGPSFEAQVFCNRSKNHPPPHRRYDERTFAVIAEWELPIETDPFDRKRRKVIDYEASQHEAAARRKR